MSLLNLQDIYDRLNQNGFEGALPTIPLEWSTRMTKCSGTFGYVRNRLTGAMSKPKIRLSVPVLGPHPEEVENVLAHEMIHFWEALKYNHSSHGAIFQSKMHRLNRQLGLKITLQHELEVSYNHVWSCGCGKATIKRQRYDERTNIKAGRCYCRGCHGRLTYLKP